MLRNTKEVCKMKKILLKIARIILVFAQINTVNIGLLCLAVYEKLDDLKNRIDHQLHYD